MEGQSSPDLNDFADDRHFPDNRDQFNISRTMDHNKGDGMFSSISLYDNISRGINRLHESRYNEHVIHSSEVYGIHNLQGMTVIANKASEMSNYYTI